MEGNNWGRDGASAPPNGYLGPADGSSAAVLAAPVGPAAVGEPRDGKAPQRIEGGRAGTIRQPSGPARAALVAPAGIAAASLVVIAIGFVHPLSYAAPTWRATLETAVTLLAFAAAGLVRAQFAYSGRLRDVLLMAALLTLGLMNFCCYTLPAALGLRAPTAFSAAGFVGELLVAALFVVAVVVRSDLLVADGRRVSAAVLALGVVSVVAADLSGLLLRGEFPTGNGPAPSIHAALQSPVPLGMVLAAAGLFLFAAVVLIRLPRPEKDSVTGLLAGALVGLAAARLYYLALPAAGSGLIAPSQGLRVLAAVLLLLAAERREVGKLATVAQSAAIAERRRVARDLHDGVAQDLAFIAAHGARIADQMGEEHPVAVAAKRALAVSRSTIAELNGQAGGTAREALEAVTSELRDRFEIPIVVHTQLDSELEPEARDQVTRIVREAIANACRHGGAEHVTVSLDQTRHGKVLRVLDDGCGIVRPGGAPADEGFGLRSMRERAAALGGRLTVGHRDDGGTELEVLLP